MTRHPPEAPELLAPAGSFEAACAALQYGADAVYLGLPRHSARAEAVNLDAGALQRIVHHAHGLSPRRAVHLTLNTLIRDDELASVLDSLETAAAAEVDALIIQDLAVYRLARRYAPNIPLHASTQMAVHDADGARALAELGFARVVLARELSLDEIAAIARQAPIEVEVFVHGALCYAFSGLCLFSALQAGRSGNRGQCAYCCRERFTAPDGTAAYPFSMRDLARLDRLDDLRRAGVASLKIEGRMKSPLYVAAVTDLYRRKLAGTLSPRDEAEAIADVQTIFSRPWTALHLDGPQPPDQVIDPLAVGHRGTPIGQVEAVRRDRTGNTRWLALTTSRALEKHDGLQIERPQGGRPFGFGIAQMRRADAARLEVTVPAGSRVAIALPPDAPVLPVGAPVFCSASQAVQRRYAVAIPRLQDSRPTRPLRVEVTLDAKGMRVRGEPVGEPGLAVTLEAAEPLALARQAGQTPTAVRKAFERLGESAWRLAELTVHDPDGHYAPPSRLNAVRRQLQEQLDANLHAQQTAAHAARLAELTEALAQTGGLASAPMEACAESPSAGPVTAARLSVQVELAREPRVFDDADELVLALRVADAGVSLEDRIRAWQAVMPAVPIRLALPAIVRGEAATQAIGLAMRRLLDRGWTRWECTSLAGLRRLRGLTADPLSITAAGALYGLNRLACRQLAELGAEGVVAPAEADAGTLLALARQRTPRLIVPLYQRPPLFIAATRPAAAVTGNTAGDIREWTDRRGRRFRVDEEDGLWLTRSVEPLQRLDQRPQLLAAGVSEFRLDLVGEPPGVHVCTPADLHGQPACDGSGCTPAASQNVR